MEFDGSFISALNHSVTLECTKELLSLQLSEVSLYPCGLALLEQTLITLETHGAFESQVC